MAATLVGGTIIYVSPKATESWRQDRAPHVEKRSKLPRGPNKRVQKLISDMEAATLRKLERGRGSYAKTKQKAPQAEE
jgi:hypothetical protein